MSEISEGTTRRGRGADLVAFGARHRVLLSLLVLAVLPWVVPYTALGINILIFGLFALGFNLIFGYTGMLSFGHAAFFGLGAYGCGVPIARLDWPWFVSLPFAVLLAGAVAAVMGWLAIRTRGIYFAMVTLALSQIVYYVAFQWISVTGGEDGLRGVSVPAVEVLGLRLDLLDPMQKYYFIFAFVALAVWLLSRILSSPFGAVLEAVRENERRAAACGYDVARTRWLAFTLSGMFSGLAGALYAIHLSVVPIETLHYFNSAAVVMMALLGGMGTFFGPFIGAFLYLMLEDAITLITVYWQFFLGWLFVFLILFSPRGIWGSLLHWLRLR